ncbi:MAG: class I tRNA ligase family protein, partial [Pseudomonadota bacterium]|nr:class I tRNA ligase family protein [Pseudomonadota bacterium]
FDDMADAIYHFTWGTFCDWYVELVKGAFDDETKRVAAWAFDQILVMLHPLMPFITEELWSAMPVQSEAEGGERPYELIVAKWPEPEAEIDSDSKAELDWLIRLVGEIRSARTELNVPPGAKLHLFAGDAAAKTANRLDRQFATLSRLARLESIQLSAFTGSGAAQIVVDETSYALPLEGIIDLEAEKARLAKAAEAAEKERDGLAQRLSNPNFVERAKPEAVDKARSDHSDKSAEAERYRAALERLG